jgi:hypothetical protein
MDARVALTLVPRQAARPTAAVEQSPGHGRLQRLTLVRLAGGDVEGYDETVFVANQVDLGAKTTSRTPQRIVKRLLDLRLLMSSQPPRTAPLFPPSGGSPTGPDDGTVYAPQVVVELALVVQLVQERGDDANPSAIPPPSVESSKYGLPWSVGLGEVTPGRTGVQDPKDPVDDRAVVTWRAAPYAQLKGNWSCMKNGKPLFHHVL